MPHQFLYSITLTDGLVQAVSFSAIGSADLPAIAFSSLSDVNVAGVAKYAVLYFDATGKWVHLPADTGFGGYLFSGGGLGGQAPIWQDPLAGINFAYTDVANQFTVPQTIDYAAGDSPSLVLVQGFPTQTVNLFEAQTPGGAARAHITAELEFSNYGPGGVTTTQVYGVGAGSANTTGDNNVYVGYRAGNTGTTARFNVCIGADSDVAASGTSEATAIGGQASAAANSTAIGRGANASGSSSVAIGQTATASGSTAVCVGAGQTVSVSGGVGVGTGNTVNGASGVAVGKNNSVATKNGCVMLGEEATAEADGELRFSNRQTGGTFLIVSSVSSTTGNRKQWRVSGTWVDNTDASRKARAVFEVYDTAVREAFRIEASGTAPMIGFLGAGAVVRQTSGADLTNNVTAGGTDDTIADFTDLIIYANDAATIRDDIYQLARKVKQINDALRLYGLLT